MVSGCIAEQPSICNSNRYLVFFDNGSVDYIQPIDSIHLIDSFTIPVERLSIDHIYFMRNYFAKYPERDLFRFKVNSQVTVYISDRWQTATVLKTDASLVRLRISTEQPASAEFWMYRGSFCLMPMFEMLMKRLETSSLCSFESYIANKKSKDKVNNVESKYLVPFASSCIPVKKRSVENNYSFKIHTCQIACISGKEFKLTPLNGSMNPLGLPILYGWHRTIYKQSNFPFKIVQFLAPCGKKLRTIHEINRYLTVTESSLTIDRFSFDLNINLKNEFKLTNCKNFISYDLSKGKEKLPIECVNCVDKSKPDFFEYTCEQIPLQVNVNKILECCCSCIDNCNNKADCACWQKSRPNGLHKSGYRSRRLLDIVPTGRINKFRFCF